jgi:phosphoserine phosphatase
MSARPSQRRLSVADMEAILAVTSKLAAPFDLMTMLGEVVAAAKQVLGADRGSVWLHDPATDELVLEVATGIEPVRVPSGVGLVGACARNRSIINVPDCYADPRFDPGVDKASGYRTRCMLTLPLVDHKDVLRRDAGPEQANGVFDADDEALATALAAQCAVALQRVRMTESLIEGEKMRQELEMAREVQMSTWPATMPRLRLRRARDGQACRAHRRRHLRPGSDRPGVADCPGRCHRPRHCPALSVTQMQAMLRIAFRLGADLETAFRQVNNQLADTLADDRFITAFIGLLIL